MLTRRKMIVHSGMIGLSAVGFASQSVLSVTDLTSLEGDEAYYFGSWSNFFVVQAEMNEALIASLSDRESNPVWEEDAREILGTPRFLNAALGRMNPPIRFTNLHSLTENFIDTWLSVALYARVGFDTDSGEAIDSAVQEMLKGSELLLEIVSELELLDLANPYANSSAHKIYGQLSELASRK